MHFTIFTLFLAHAVTSQTQSIALACPTLNEIKNDLDVNLSTGSSITSRADDAPRWSLYGAPRPVLFVKVASERDVAKTVSLMLPQYTLRYKSRVNRFGIATK